MVLFGGLDNKESVSDDVHLCTIHSSTDPSAPSLTWELVSRPPHNLADPSAARSPWPVSRWRHTAAAATVDGEMNLVVFGGLNAYDALLDDTWAFNPVTRAWRKLEPPPNPFLLDDDRSQSTVEGAWGPPTPRSCSATAAGDGVLFLFGGYSRVAGKLISEDTNDLFCLGDQGGGGTGIGP